MKRALIWLLSFILISSSVLYAQDFSGKNKEIALSSPLKSLDPNEELNYSIEWLGIPVGNIILKVEGIEDIEGHSCYHIVARMSLNKFMRRLYDLRYETHTYLDTQSLFTRRFRKFRSVKNENTYINVDFQQEKNLAITTTSGASSFMVIPIDLKKVSAQNNATNKVPLGTQDLLSVFYYFRFLDIKAEHTYPVNIYYDQRNWLMDAKVGKPFFRDIRKRGSFAVVNISLDSRLNDYILGKRGLMVNLSADSRRIPIEFKIGTALGPIHAKIVNLPAEEALRDDQETAHKQ